MTLSELQETVVAAGYKDKYADFDESWQGKYFYKQFDRDGRKELHHVEVCKVQEQDFLRVGIDNMLFRISCFLEWVPKDLFEKFLLRDF